MIVKRGQVQGRNRPISINPFRARESSIALPGGGTLPISRLRARGDGNVSWPMLQSRLRVREREIKPELAPSSGLVYTHSAKPIPGVRPLRGQPSGTAPD